MNTAFGVAPTMTAYGRWKDAVTSAGRPRMLTRTSAIALAAVLALQPRASNAEDADADALAKTLANPVSSMASVPFQYNFDDGFAHGGYRHTLNIQPVLPMSVSEHWNLISRTILPVTYQEDIIPGTDQAGIGDINQSVFFVPKQPGPSGLIWGAGPVALIPTGTDGLSAHTWAVGPTVVMLKQNGPWTYGALANHLWDVAGGQRRVDISTTFLQPFLSRTLGGGLSVSVNFESTYDWIHSQWTVPLNVSMSKVTKIGSQRISVGGGLRAYLEVPDGGPDWGARITVTLLYPTGAH